MNTNQKYYPHFGYMSPRKTKYECENPAFADKKLHRIGLFAAEFHSKGLNGYSCIVKCVNCGKEFDYTEGMKRVFVPSKKKSRYIKG